MTMTTIITKETLDAGMNLRDYFAGQALAGLLADRPSISYTDTMATKAYAYADAMLKAREAGQ